MRSRSPIEIMVDRACGLPDDWRERAAEKDITMRCPQCGRIKSTDRVESDPPGTKVIESNCPLCIPEKSDLPRYFDANNKELFI